MRKETFIVLFLLFGLAFAGISDARECSSRNQTILTLYQEYNTHAALFNSTASDSNAQVPVCYDEIFGESWTKDNNPWVCSGANNIVFLSMEKNAHLSMNSNYPFRVCFGDLVCAFKTSCQADEKSLISLSGEENAHAGSPEFYPNKICCKRNEEAQVYGLKTNEWRNYYGYPINEANVNDTVKLYVESFGEENTNVQVKIKKKRFLIPDIIVQEYSSALVNGKTEFAWNINDSVMDGENREFYFEVDKSGIINRSAILRVTNRESCYETLNIEISKPLNERYYTAGELEINYSLLGPPGEGRGLINEWSIDGEKRNELSLKYNFQTFGLKKIHLKARNACGAEVEREISILILKEGINVFPLINHPRYAQVFKFNGQSNVSIVYNGSDSYAIEYTLGNAMIINDVNLMHYNWSRSSSGVRLWLKGGLGNASGESYFGFDGSSGNPNDKSYNLNLSYMGESANNWVNFSVGLCSADKRKMLRLNSDNVMIGKVSTIRGDGTFFDPNACKGEDGSAGTPDDCCPAGYGCGNDGCYILPVNIIAPAMSDDCSIYSKQIDCENAIASVNDCNPEFVRSGRCRWRNNRCVSEIVSIDSITGAVVNTLIKTYTNISSCSQSTGFWKVNISTICTSKNYQCNPEECSERIVELPCGRPTFQLPLFGFWQLVISIAGIIIIYFVKSSR